MFSLEDGKENRIRTEKYFVNALEYIKSDENVKEIFEFNDEDTECLGCVWRRNEEVNINVANIPQKKKKNIGLMVFPVVYGEYFQTHQSIGHGIFFEDISEGFDYQEKMNELNNIGADGYWSNMMLEYRKQ